MTGDLIFALQREQALTVPCGYCDAEIGRRCTDPRTGYELIRQPAHQVRLNARPEPESVA